ncbi:MAG: adenosylcobalamin-dependent ribonucleoside-diphosphate reductase [Porticoccaceae bacterium]
MAPLSPVSQKIWERKYRFRAPTDAPIERSIEDTWDRVATALAAPEAEPALWAGRFRDALTDFKFMPAGRILAGAGTARDVTLCNCFVMGTIPDDMGGIFEHLREAALTLQQGGGIGYDFSTLRPRGAPVHGIGADASGPVSFMAVWDAMCATILSAGYRRGAMMASLACDHPDIEDFVAAKAQPGRLTHFNLSVLVSDAFMAAVRADAPWELKFGGAVFRTLPARALWERILRAGYDSAEPGVIFIDRINARNNLGYCETIATTNPCGEQPLPPYGACVLGSVNLAALVERPFASDAALDLEQLAAVTRLGVRMLDNAIDVSRFPLDAQRREARAKRRIGLGVTGLADALILCGLTYGSAEALAATERWLLHLRRAVYLASTELAAEKGAFPLFDRDRYLAGANVRALEPELRAAIAEHGMRNGLVTSVAPTGTISLVADNLSSGLEPVYALTYARNILLPDGTRCVEHMTDHAYRLFRQIEGERAALPATFVTARELAPAAHLAMQAAVQKYIDAAVSKTINLPAEISFGDFRNIYDQAYDLGCKGCTTYRPNAVRGAVLSDDGQAFRRCAKCAAAARIHQEGCDICTACGDSRCL